jgi:hypothetical protein
MSATVRAEFGPAKAQLPIAALCTVLGVLTLGGAVAIALMDVTPRTVPPIVLLGIIGLLALGIGVSMLWRWLPRYRLTVSEDGVSVRTRGRDIHIAWSEIDWWSVARPTMAPDRYPERLRDKVRLEMVVATPASHVTNPAEGARRLLWSRTQNQWILCQPAQTDGTTEEIVQAFLAYAPNKRRELT